MPRNPSKNFRDWVLILLLFAGWPASAMPEPDDAAELLRQRVEHLNSSEIDTSEIDASETAGAGNDIPFAAPSVLHGFYQNRDFTLAWNDVSAHAFVAMVQDAESQGLDPADYLQPQLTALPQLSALSGSARSDADLLLTEAFLRFVYHCRFGKVDPNSLEPTWNYSRFVAADGPFSALNRILRAEDFTRQFTQEMGHGPVYDAMRALLARYRGFAANGAANEVATGAWHLVALGPTLRANDRDPRVAALRARLGAEAYQADTTVEPERFDPELVGATQAFQRSHGLADDGIVGKRTLEELNVPAQDRVEQIRVNLERLRWVLIDRAPRVVVVNIAGFRVYYVEDDRATWSARAVVGRRYRETPVFRAEMKYLVLNPDWTVPPTILRKDVLPAMRLDPTYLTNHQMEVIDAKGRPIDTASIDWSLYPRASFPYLIRQRPGQTNSLGRIKFIFPNPHFVFLHDTTAKNLFEQPDRTFSSGCIRLENPLELAQILLRSKREWTPAAIDAAIAAGATKTVFLDKPIPVLLLYLTAIAFDDGRDFAFYRDVYGRDAAVWKALNEDFVYVPPQGMSRHGA